MDWQALGTAFALVFVIEGLMPFANPQGSKRVMAVLANAEPRTFRIIGALSIVSGLSLLALIRL